MEKDHDDCLSPVASPKQKVATEIRPYVENAGKDRRFDEKRNSMPDNLESNICNSKLKNTERPPSVRNRHPFFSRNAGIAYTEIKIDKNFTGHIIGKGRSKIRELESSSGANIKIKQRGNSSEYTSIRLTGSVKSQEKAKSLIENLTEEFNSMYTRKLDKDSAVATPSDIKNDNMENQEICQEFILGSDEDRQIIFKKFLNGMKKEDKVIVFVENSIISNDLGSDVALFGFEAQCIHNNMKRYEIEQALEDIRSGYIQILISSHITSRGLDMKNFTHVFNFNFPQNVDEYVYRVSGARSALKVVSIFTFEDRLHAERLVEILKQANYTVPQELYDMSEDYTLGIRARSVHSRNEQRRRF